MKLMAMSMSVLLLLVHGAVAAELRAGTVNPRLRSLKASPLVPPKVLAREKVEKPVKAIFVSANPGERNRILALTKGFAAVSVVATHEEAKALLDEMVLTGGSK